MNTTSATPETADVTPATPSAAAGAPWMRHVWLIGGGVALATAGVAAGFAWRPAPPAELAPTAAIAADAEQKDKAADKAEEKPADKPADKPAAEKAAAQKPAVKPAPAKNAQASHATTVAAAEPKAVCATCGVVESVHAVEIKGEGTGLGAVAGGVLGGVLGNQVGKGNGRKAMTVLGAVGGGLAGHEVEKRARSETVYDVTVRMDDGSARTLRQKTAPEKGAHVTVEGSTLQVSKPATSA